MSYVVLLTTSGTGSRLGELTRNTNKALVEINGRPAVDYILRNYAVDTEFVVTLGYLGDQVRERLTELYPDRKFTFVEVDKWQGEGSSLGYSMLQAQDVLQRPFIFHCCDTLTTAEPPAPDRNWIAGCRLDDATQYRTLNIQGDQVIGINDKGAPNFDFIHIGLVGVNDYAGFWKHMGDLYRENPADDTLNDTFAINRMLEAGIGFDFVEVPDWFDTGNPQALARTAELLKEKNA
jgi:glucose-1-phosphate thymidylyltransferase